MYHFHRGPMLVIDVPVYVILMRVEVVGARFRSLHSTRQASAQNIWDGCSATIRGIADESLHILGLR